jgi:tetratricopeptide (TPR) repeat protein
MTVSELAAALAHRQAGRIVEAERLYRSHLTQTPSDAEALYDLGVTMIERGRHAPPLAAAMAPALTDLATDLLKLGAIEHAIEIYRAAIDLDSQHAMAHMGLGMALLTLGRLQEGWPEYEWHRRLPGHSQTRFAAPLWDGQYRPGMRVLVHAEQGFGDTLQFARYASVLKRGGAQVILGCAGALKRLLALVQGVDSVIAHGERIPAHDFHMPLLSLPGLFKTELASIPGPVGYVSAPADDIEIRRRQLAGLKAPRVGLVWQGNLNNHILRGRSIALARLLPVLQQRGISFVSLQVDEGRMALAEIAPAHRPFDPFAAEPARDFIDTAATMANLDLVISIDTASAHLAGAMGRPVWTLLTSDPDWRWLRGREDSPWYPAMRLFRQRRAGDWDEVLGRVGAALAEHFHAGQ